MCLRPRAFFAASPFFPVVYFRFSLFLARAAAPPLPPAFVSALASLPARFLVSFLFLFASLSDFLPLSLFAFG